MRGESAVAAAAWALGAWCASGVIAPVAADWSSRIGAFAPAWWLGVLLVGALTLVAFARPSPRSVAPLWVPLVSVLPWLPVPLPAAAMLGVGPLGQLLAATSALVCFVAVAFERRGVFDARTRAATPSPATRCAVQRVGVVGVAAHPRRRRTALPDHHPEPAVRWRPAHRGQPSTAGICGLRRRRIEAGLSAAGARWRDLLDSRARRVGARAARILAGGLSRGRVHRCRAECARPDRGLALRGRRDWKCGRSRDRHSGRGALGPVLLPGLHDLPRWAGGRGGRRGGLARARAARGANLAVGAGLRSSAGRPALAAHALRGHCRSAGTGRGRTAPVAAHAIGALAVADACARGLRGCRRC